MSKWQKERRNIILCCMIWAMFGVINLAVYYNAPEPKVFWNDKRVQHIEVDHKLQVGVQDFCKALALEYTLDGNELIVGGDAAQVIKLNDLTPTAAYAGSAAVSRVPVENLCKALGIPYEWDEKQQIIRLGESVKQAQAIPVLMYHHILPRADVQGIFAHNNIVVTLEDFQAQMAYLRDNGYHTVSLERLERYVKGEELLPEKSVVITFDDGYLSNYVYAYPILKEMGFTGVIFLLTSYVEEAPQTFSPEALQYLSWPEVHQMEDVFQFASHTHDMHRLGTSGKGVLAEVGYNELVADLSASRKLLRHTPYFSFPYGHYSKLALDTLQGQGIKMAFTVNEVSVKMGDDPLTLGRWDVVRHTDLDKFKTLFGQ